MRRQLFRNAVADRRAVAFTIRTIPVPAPPNTICTAVGYTRTAVLHLVKPLGARVLHFEHGWRRGPCHLRRSVTVNDVFRYLRGG